MDTDIKALKSGIWYTVANFLTKGAIIITTPIFTRLLTHWEFGAYNNYISWLNIISIFVTLNLDSTFIRARYDYEKEFDQYISSMLFLSSLSALIWFGILNIFSSFFQKLLVMDIKYINYMMLYLFFIPAISMYQVRERYNFRYKMATLLSLIVSFGTLVFSVALVNVLSDKLFGKILGSVAPSVLIGMILYGYIIYKGRCLKIQHWKYALPICLPFIPHLLSMTVLSSIDKVMIVNFCGEEENALYSLAYTCGSAAGMFISSLNTAFSPWLGSKLYENRLTDINNFSRKYISIFVFLSIGIMLISPEILFIFGGSSYLDAIYIMPPIALGSVCQFFYTMFVNVEQYKKKTVGMAMASASAAFINFGLNYLLIPKFGYIVAAYTTLIGFVWLLLIHMYLVKRIGYKEVYDYKFISKIMCGMFLFTGYVTLLYKLFLIRFVSFVIYIIIFFVFIKKYRYLVKQLVKKKISK